MAIADTQYSPPPPKFLYKYRSIDQGDIAKRRSRYGFDRDIILNSHLWAGSPADFNDPYDCFPVLRLSASQQDHIDWLARCYLEDHPEASADDIQGAVIVGLTKIDDGTVRSSLEAAWKTNLKSSGALSLTSNSNHMGMWSFYAKDHYGYCLEFDTNFSPFFEARKVIYDDVRPIYNVLSPDSEAEIYRAYLRKSRYWKTEKEWRIVRYKSAGTLAFDPLSLRSIIFGAKMLEEDKDAIRNMVSNRSFDIAIKQARLDDKSYQIIID